CGPRSAPANSRHRAGAAPATGDTLDTVADVDLLTLDAEHALGVCRALRRRPTSVSRSLALPMERNAIGAGQPADRPPLPILTTLRFFAAAEVVAFHAAQARPGWTTPVGILSGLVSGGYPAVVFFFVLSGFILAYVHSGENGRGECNVGATRF